MKTHKTSSLKTIKDLLYKAKTERIDFNLQIQGNFYYSIDGWIYRLRQGELIPEQWSPSKECWVTC